MRVLARRPPLLDVNRVVLIDRPKNIDKKPKRTPLYFPKVWEVERVNSKWAGTRSGPGFAPC